MSPKEQHDLPRARGIYLLPNLFTMTALFAGFYAVVAAMKGHFDVAAIAIFVAMIMDNLDGRVARLTNTQTAFGAEFDSISDMVSFGIAPALVAYSYALTNLGKIGWLAAFIYTAAVALRLARFNIQHGKVDKRYFIGLASPMGAGIIAGWIWVADDFGMTGTFIDIVTAVLAILVGLMMVSKIRYRSFKDLDVRGKVPFLAILILVLVYVLISLDPPEVLFLVFLGYGLSGPVMMLWNSQKRKLKKKKKITKDSA